ncbi:hypothetical protein GCM10009551_097690 [Nocardiopsis tropica]
MFMKRGFIGAILVVAGVVVLVLWARAAIDSGIPEEWPPSLVSGQLLAIGAWLALIGVGSSVLYSAVRYTKLFRTGDRLHARASVFPVAGYSAAAIGMTAVAWSAVFDLFWGDGDRALVPALAAPVLIAIWVLVSISALAGRIWWPAIEADAERVVVSTVFERTTFRRGLAQFDTDRGTTVVHGPPRQRDRSPLSVLLRYRGNSVHVPTIRLRAEALAALNEGSAPGESRRWDPGIAVPPR